MSDIYRVTLIHRGREKDYFDFSRRGRTTDAKGQPLEASEVGFDVLQSGRDRDQAIEAVRRKHPGLQVDVERVTLLDADG